jgi:hypothetical protein
MAGTAAPALLWSQDEAAGRLEGRSVAVVAALVPLVHNGCTLSPD